MFLVKQSEQLPIPDPAGLILGSAGGTAVGEQFRRVER